MESLSNEDFFEILEVTGLTKNKLIELAKLTKFQIREPRKISALNFFSILCLEAIDGSPSCNDIADASRQAVNKKFNESCLNFFKTILAHIILTKIPASEIENIQKRGIYKRILVQDSTIIKLPIRLFEIFSGVSNSYKSVCNARIQGVYDLVSGAFIYFTIDSYSKNDISVAPNLEFQKNDLVLRDRGYFSIAEITRHNDNEANCIYRYKHKTVLLNPKTNKVIDLEKLLKRKKTIDMDVYLNSISKTKVRLVAMPVSEEIANQRRMKAKKEMKGKNPSAELLRSMGWTIFITNITKEEADFKQLDQIYSLRWRIEIIFKSWKSNMQFEKVHNISENQLRILLTARFIMIVICMQIFYNPWLIRIRENNQRELSMLKFIKYLMRNTEKWSELLSIHQNKNQICITKTEKALIRYCCYEKRKRLNFNQIANESFA
jgi:hypothetical protein